MGLSDRANGAPVWQVPIFFAGFRRCILLQALGFPRLVIVLLWQTATGAQLVQDSAVEGFAFQERMFQ